MLSIEQTDLAHTTWMNAVETVPGKIGRCASGKTGAALLYSEGARLMLRIAPTAECGPCNIAAFERLAEQEGACAIETQGKVPAASRVAASLHQRGFEVSADVSRVFELDVSTASDKLRRLRAAVRHRVPHIRVMHPCTVEPIAQIVQHEELLDDFEFFARLLHQGSGGMHMEECPVLEDAQGVAGFILIARSDTLDAREIKVRWVAPRYRDTALLNLALLLDCLDRAAQADVRYARFSANTQRHADTLVLAASLGARHVGDQLAFNKQLG